MVQQDAPTLDAATARTILDTLDELGVGLSERQIRLKRAAQAALAHWAEAERSTYGGPRSLADQHAMWGGRQ